MTRRSLLAAAACSAFGATSGTGFCIGTYGMKTLSAKEAIELTAGIGYDGIELALMPGWVTDPAALSSVQRAELRRMLRNSGLAVPSLVDQLPITGEPEKRKYNLQRLKLAADLGHYLSPARPPVFETMLGGKTEEWEQCRNSIADELSAWAKIAEASNMTVCFKPHAGHAVHSPERALWLIDKVRSPKMRIVYDYCHMFAGHFGLEKSLRELGRHISFITLKDARWTQSGYEFLLPGEGDTDYTLYFRLLRELGYQGSVGVEVSSMIHRRPGYDPAVAAQVCYSRMAPLLKASGLRRSRQLRRT